MDQLYGAERADGVARQPDFAVGALADAAQEFVIGDGRRLANTSFGVRMGAVVPC